MSAELKLKFTGDSAGATKAIADVENSLKKLKPATASASGAITDFSRIIQDAPFGFQAIGNNIDQLSGTLGRLREEARSSGQTLGGVLLNSLKGGAGVGLAISAVTAAVTFATVGFGAWTRGLGGTAKAAKEVSEVTGGMAKALDAATEAVAKDASRVTTLVNALNSGTLNLEQRKSALAELKRINAEFFGSLKDEKGTIEGLQLAYDGYLQRILAIGRAKAIESQLTKLFDKKLELELKLDPKFAASTSANVQQEVGRLKKQLDALGGPVSQQESEKYWELNEDGSVKVNESLQKRFDLQKRIGELQSGQNIIIFDQNGALAKQIELIDRQIKGLSELQKQTSNFDVTAASSKAPGGEKKDPFDIKRVFAQNQIDIAEGLAKLDAEFRKEFGNIGESSAKAFGSGFSIDAVAELNRIQGIVRKVAELQKIGLNPPSIDSLIANPNANASFLDVLFPPDIVEQAAVRKKLVEESILSIATGVQDALISVADSIGTALGRGGSIGQVLAAAGETLLKVIGGVLQDVGKQVIIASGLVKLMQKALASLFTPAGPAAGIAIGASLIALGAVLKNIRLTKVQPFAEGGVVMGPTMGLVGEAGKEAIIPLDRIGDVLGSIGAGQSVFVSGRLSGETIYLQQQRTGDRRSRFV